MPGITLSPVHYIAENLNDSMRVSVPTVGKGQACLKIDLLPETSGRGVTSFTKNFLKFCYYQ